MFLLTIAGGIAWLASSLAQDLPSHEALGRYEPAVLTRVHAADGELLGEFAAERRLYLPIYAIPEEVKQAFLSAEDRSFYRHGGLDFYGIGRAVLHNLRSRDDPRWSGGSTITQQVAKNMLLTNEQTVERKMKEAILAARIEKTYSKDRILELYLNQIFFGQGAYGVAAAALIYFDKSLYELSLAEIAYLAALPKGPNNYNPFTRPEAAIERRDWVIDRMVEDGFVNPAEAAAAKAQPLGVKPRRERAPVFSAKAFSPPFLDYFKTIYGEQLRALDGLPVGTANYFTEEVRREILARFGEDKLYRGGLSVRTSLVPEMQVLARRMLMQGMIKYDIARGWRGPVRNIGAPGEDWNIRLAEVPRLFDVFEWKLAVVLAVGKDGAQIGLQPGRDDAGRLEKNKETGIIPPSELRWAGNRARGVKPMAAGDVVYVEPLDGAGSFALRQPPAIQGGMVVMHPRSGRVMAMVGGFSFADSQFNRATQAMRQPGSSFKPFVYAAALDNGYTPASIALDGPIEIDQGPGLPPWRPENYSQNFLGPSTLRTGIEQSRNLMTVHLAKDVGTPIIAEYAKRFGIYDEMLPVLSMVLGAGETTLLRMAGGYATIANGGRKVRPSLIDRIQDRTGATIYTNEQRACPGCQATAWRGQEEPYVEDDRPQVIDRMTAYQITSMMEGVVQRGTATIIRSKVSNPIAGKTGTTNDFHDAWFVGFSADIVVAVYLGYDQPRSLGVGNTGGVIAAPIVGDFFKVALTGRPSAPFKPPPGMIMVRVDRKTGERAGNSGAPAEAGGGVILEAFKPGTAPSVAAAVRTETNVGFAQPPDPWLNRR